MFLNLPNFSRMIHEKGYVHSDIRDINIVFSADGTDAWIIGFDLAVPEGDEDFSHHNIYERHPGAQAG